MSQATWPPPTILIATGNPHKAEELVAILGAVEGTRFITLADLAVPPPEPDEDGATLEANAYIKAREIHLATGLPTIADDTGLEVASLDGAPGVRSARYAGENATYADNCRQLLDELRGRSGPDRNARFRTVVCYTDHLRTFVVEGEVTGRILDEPRGKSGFGYDPLFLPTGLDRTFAELTPEEKNNISHRANALGEMKLIIINY